MSSRDIRVILHDIRSSENVGSIMRTADAVGATCVYLTGYTPAPLDRFGRINAKLTKASLGAEEFVPWEKVEIQELIARLKSEGVVVVSVEQSARSIPYTEFKSKESVVLIFGNEVDGVPEEILQASDAVVEIPMRGKKESLNVAVSAGIALYELSK